MKFSPNDAKGIAAVRSDDDEPGEEPPSTRQMLKALQIFREEKFSGQAIPNEIRQHQTHEQMIMKMTEEEKTQSTLDGFKKKKKIR